ncbi:hypothetical protein PVAG01_01151 [Phlyctema vagabunda]|uniref:Uncharacterized protein n=1 Tax=Phlyctema vagabunda TaxID=108571 RepID=A0ABR4PWU4_9HELO
MLYNITLKVLFVASLASAAAIPALSFEHINMSIHAREAGATAEAQLLQIAPTSDSCAGAAFADECATAAEAAPFLIEAMSTYKIHTAPEMAAVLSLIAFESGDFQFAKNHFPAPGRPGQGTRNMQMANYNLQYAASIAELKAPLAAITTATSTEGLSDDDLNAIRALVLDDRYSWASAAWFLTTQCAPEVRTALQAGGQSGFDAYMGCIGTSATEDRLAYWKRANTAFGL